MVQYAMLCHHNYINAVMYHGSTTYNFLSREKSSVGFHFHGRVATSDSEHGQSPRQHCLVCAWWSLCVRSTWTDSPLL